MPYTESQCRLFAAKAARGEKVPADWRKHCRKDRMKKRKKATRKR